MIVWAETVLSAIELIRIEFAPGDAALDIGRRVGVEVGDRDHDRNLDAADATARRERRDVVARGRLHLRGAAGRDRDVAGARRARLGVAAFEILSTVTPIAARPVVTLRLKVDALCVPSAVTLNAPATDPCAPDEAFSVPLRSTTATPTPRPRPRPAATVMTYVSGLTWSLASTFRKPSGFAPPLLTATLPIVAEELPSTLTIATAAPAAASPKLAPIA